MKRLTRIQSVTQFLTTAQKIGTLGFVPTMGAFHEGHLSLMRKAKAECDFVVVSLFVNPLQFGPDEDFKIYPRTLAEDRLKAVSVGVDLFWTPAEKDLFPAGFQTQVEVTEISQNWEGESRPAHFRGVSTVVTKLLQIVRPDRLYLGQKDFQQCCVIRQMMRDLHFETKLRVCAIIREKDGLAMSSRNKRLTAKERKIAPLLYQALKTVKSQVKSGERNGLKLIQIAEDILKPSAQIKIDYLALCDENTLKPLKQLNGRAVFLLAVQLGAVRLIDNIRLEAGPCQTIRLPAQTRPQ